MKRMYINTLSFLFVCVYILLCSCGYEQLTTVSENLDRNEDIYSDKTDLYIETNKLKDSGILTKNADNLASIQPSNQEQNRLDKIMNNCIQTDTAEKELESCNDDYKSTYGTADKWKRLYIEFINDIFELNVNETTYHLIYINDDDIPELYITNVDEFYRSVLCTVSGDTIDVLYSDNKLLYIEHNNIFLVLDMHMTHRYQGIWTIKDGSFAVLHEGYSYYDDSDNWEKQEDEDGNITYITGISSYIWDEEEISSTDYFRILSEIFDVSITIEIDEYSSGYNYDEIIKMIKGM